MSSRQSGRTSPVRLDEGLTPAQYTFALAYMENGFNARRAYLAAHQTALVSTAGSEGHRTLNNPKVRVFLNARLEDAWRPWQIGGEQALARIALLASGDIRDLYDPQSDRLLPRSDWPDDIAARVRSIKEGPDGPTVTIDSALPALRTILEQTGKLKAPGDTMDALADAIRADRKTHGLD